MMTGREVAVAVGVITRHRFRISPLHTVFPLFDAAKRLEIQIVKQQ
jgi:hypothetical protein